MLGMKEFRGFTKMNSETIYYLFSDGTVISTEELKEQYEYHVEHSKTCDFKNLSDYSDYWVSEIVVKICNKTLIKRSFNVLDMLTPEKDYVKFFDELRKVKLDLLGNLIIRGDADWHKLKDNFEWIEAIYKLDSEDNYIKIWENKAIGKKLCQEKE